MKKRNAKKDIKETQILRLAHKELLKELFRIAGRRNQRINAVIGYIRARNIA